MAEAFHQGRTEGWQGGHNSLGAESLRGRRKVPTMSQVLFHLQYSYFRETIFEHWAVKLASCPERHLTLLSPCFPCKISSQSSEFFKLTVFQS